MSDAKVKSTIAVKKTFRVPSLATIQPLSGISTGERHQVRGDDQPDRGDRDVEIGTDARDCGGDDRAVEVLHEEAGRDEKGDVALFGINHGVASTQRALAVDGALADWGRCASGLAASGLTEWGSGMPI
jgi:hypothetical protein